MLTILADNMILQRSSSIFGGGVEGERHLEYSGDYNPKSTTIAILNTRFYSIKKKTDTTRSTYTIVSFQYHGSDHPIHRSAREPMSEIIMCDSVSLIVWAGEPGPA